MVGYVHKASASPFLTWWRWWKLPQAHCPQSHLVSFLSVLHVSCCKYTTLSKSALNVCVYNTIKQEETHCWGASKCLYFCRKLATFIPTRPFVWDGKCGALNQKFHVFGQLFAQQIYWQRSSEIKKKNHAQQM